MTFFKKFILTWNHGIPYETTVRGSVETEPFWWQMWVETCHYSLVRNFTNCWPTFNILSPRDSEV